MKKLIALSCALVVGSVIAGSVAAQAGMGGGKMKADATRAEMRAEMQAMADAQFKNSDTNHDGKLSLVEMQDAAKAKVTEHFSKLDINNDGGVTQEEMRQSREHYRDMFRQHQDMMGGGMKHGK